MIKIYRPKANISLFNKLPNSRESEREREMRYLLQIETELKFLRTHKHKHKQTNNYSDSLNRYNVKKFLPLIIDIVKLTFEWLQFASHRSKKKYNVQWQSIFVLLSNIRNFERFFFSDLKFFCHYSPWHLFYIFTECVQVSKILHSLPL